MTYPEVTTLRRQLVHGSTPASNRIPPPIRDPADFGRATDYVPTLATIVQKVLVAVWVAILLVVFMPIFLLLLLGLLVAITGQHMPC